MSTKQNISLLEIAERANLIYKKVSAYNTRLAVATKTHFERDVIFSALPNDATIIAENRVQEAEEKWEVLSSFPNEKHFIGTLQKNKVRKVVKMFDVIETIDSFELLERVERIAQEEEKNIIIFLNFNVSSDEKKGGMNEQELDECVKRIVQTPFSHVQVSGLFTILRNSLSEKEKHFFYAQMKKKLVAIQKILPQETFHELSMGMSGDFEIALQEGATIVRVGTKIFGKRD